MIPCSRHSRAIIMEIERQGMIGLMAQNKEEAVARFKQYAGDGTTAQFEPFMLTMFGLEMNCRKVHREANFPFEGSGCPICVMEELSRSRGDLVHYDHWVPAAVTDVRKQYDRIKDA